MSFSKLVENDTFAKKQQTEFWYWNSIGFGRYPNPGIGIGLEVKKCGLVHPYFTCWWNLGRIAFMAIWLKSPAMMCTASGYLLCWLLMLPCKCPRVKLEIASGGMYTVVIMTTVNCRGRWIGLHLTDTYSKSREEALSTVTVLVHPLLFTYTHRQSPSSSLTRVTGSIVPLCCVVC